MEDERTKTISTARLSRPCRRGPGADYRTPRHVLGGPAYVPPSDKITLAYIGCGTQGTRELLRMIATPEVQITAVCDPVKDGTNYVDWSRNGIRDSVRRTLEDPSWGIRRERYPRWARDGESVRLRSQTYYAKIAIDATTSKGVATYADFRQLLEKEKDLDSVKIMTPDHLHATIAIAAMKKRKNVAVHKPLSNRVSEVRMVVETARHTGVATHLLAWRAPLTAVRQMILDGAIGAVKEVHNWTDRPFWPQQLALPTDRPAVPANFDWDLWLGPEAGAAVSSRLTPTRSSAAGTISAGAASPIWAITVFGLSSWRSTYRCRTAWKRSPVPLAKSTTR